MSNENCKAITTTVLDCKDITANKLDAWKKDSDIPLSLCEDDTNNNDEVYNNSSYTMTGLEAGDKVTVVSGTSEWSAETSNAYNTLMAKTHENITLTSNCSGFGIDLNSTGVGTTLDSTSGDLTVGGNPDTTSIFPEGTYIYPDPYAPYQEPYQYDLSPYTTLTATNYVAVAPTNSKYVVFELPRFRMPDKVFLNGRLVSLGVLGDDVIAAWDKEDKLIMEELDIGAIMINNRMEISLEYDNCTFYYKVEHSLGKPIRKAGTNIIEARLISEVMR